MFCVCVCVGVWVCECVDKNPSVVAGRRQVAAIVIHFETSKQTVES